jgi:hypothetical protein
MTKILAYCEGCNYPLYESDISAGVPELGVDESTILICPNCDRINDIYAYTINTGKLT